MIPIGAIVAGALAARRGGRARQADPRVGNVVVRVLVLLAFAFAAGLAGPAHRWMGAVTALIFVALFFPGVILTFVLVPLGLPRAAYGFARVLPPILHAGETRGVAAYFGTMALLRRRALDLRLADWLDARLAREVHMRSASIAAAALLASVRGKRETSRLLFQGVNRLSWRCPGGPRRLARSWLIADAAERGEWREVAVLAGRGLTFRWAHLLGQIARRLLRDRAPSDFALWFAWACAPHRRSTLPILKRALATPRLPSVAPQAAPIPSTAAPLEAALRAHVAALQAPTEHTLLAAGEAWDAARAASSTRALLERRALSLGATTSADSWLARLLETAEGDLTLDVALLSREALARSGTLEAAALRARHRILDELETAAEALSARTKSQTSLHASGEWMEWSALKRLYDRALVNAAADEGESRRGVFAATYAPACNYAAWLFNARDEKLLANGIFRWLLAEAKLVNDEAAVKLLKKNVRAGEGS
ncbi:MAG TPA: hypothetical protein VGI39_41025 [Polyangiaceae bacterium]